ncbi:MAG TPA: T9SS type A sorting domain-containing protein, partial [Flavobacteriales bacterium]|nr:T9SS type A sorting domain-containing protein [Flavobacteriales bacterium]
YPNPSSGQVMVELELTGLVSLKVIDALGRQVQSEVFQANGAKNRRTMDLSSVAKGIYLVQVQNNGGSVTQTVVIE